MRRFFHVGAIAMKRRKTDLIVIHCSATRAAQDVSAADINRWHKQQGWSGIGYHYVITRSGALQKGRGVDEVGAHVAGLNAVSVGICLVGGLNNQNARPENNFTPQQFETLRKLLDELTIRYPGAKVCGHRDLSPDKDRDGVVEKHEWLKDCPCFEAPQWAKDNGYKPLTGAYR